MFFILIINLPEKRIKSSVLVNNSWPGAIHSLTGDSAANNRVTFESGFSSVTNKTVKVTKNLCDL